MEDAGMEDAGMGDAGGAAGVLIWVPGGGSSRDRVGCLDMM